jgi:hypothetical protein
MIIRRMQPAALLVKTVTADVYGSKEAWREAGTISLAVSLLNGSTQLSNTALTVDATHLGLTPRRGLSVNHAISLGGETYAVDFVCDDGPLSQIWLHRIKGVAADGG